MFRASKTEKYTYCFYLAVKLTNIFWESQLEEEQSQIFCNCIMGLELWHQCLRGNVLQTLGQNQRLPQNWEQWKLLLPPMSLLGLTVQKVMIWSSRLWKPQTSWNIHTLKKHMSCKRPIRTTIKFIWQLFLCASHPKFHLKPSKW
jgi:hypothetical protein